MEYYSPADFLPSSTVHNRRSSVSAKPTQLPRRRLRDVHILLPPLPPRAAVQQGRGVRSAVFILPEFDDRDVLPLSLKSQYFLVFVRRRKGGRGVSGSAAAVFDAHARARVRPGAGSRLHESVCDGWLPAVAALCVRRLQTGRAGWPLGLLSLRSRREHFQVVRPPREESP